MLFKEISSLIVLNEKTVAILTNVDANSSDADDFAFNSSCMLIKLKQEIEPSFYLLISLT